MIPVSAKRFWQLLTTSLVHECPTGNAGQWTSGMYKALHRVQSQLNLWCQCKAHEDPKTGASFECMQIDFLWFENEKWANLPKDEAEWVPAAVAIEHENLWVPRASDVDHWKVSQIAAPLRVFIGYVSTPDEIDPAASRIKSREERWYGIPEGEALVVFGHGNMHIRNFRAWSSEQGKGATWCLLPGASEEPASAAP